MEGPNKIQKANVLERARERERGRERERERERERMYRNQVRKKRKVYSHFIYNQFSIVASVSITFFDVMWPLQTSG